MTPIIVSELHDEGKDGAAVSIRQMDEQGLALNRATQDIAECGHVIRFTATHRTYRVDLQRQGEHYLVTTMDTRECKTFGPRLYDASTFPSLEDALDYLGFMLRQIKRGEFPPNEDDA